MGTARKKAAAAKKKKAPEADDSAESPRPEFTLIIDSRERNPLDFSSLCPTVVRGLKTGDYGILSLESFWTCERKSLADLWGTVISDRDRFLREIQRMRSYEFAAIVIEGTVADVLSYRPPPAAAAHFTPAQLAAHPRTIINSLMSWQVEHGIHVHFASTDRNICRALVLSLARRFWRKKDLERVVGLGPSSASPPSPPAPSSEVSPAA